MLELKVITAMKAQDGTWKATAIGQDRLPGDLTTWPDLERVTDYLATQGWSMEAQTDGANGDKIVTVKRTVESELDRLYRSLGYQQGPITTTPEQQAMAEGMARDVIRGT